MFFTKGSLLEDGKLAVVGSRAAAEMRTFQLDSSGGI